MSSPDWGTPAPLPDQGTQVPAPDWGTPAPLPDQGTQVPAPDWGTPPPPSDWGTAPNPPEWGTPALSPDWGTPPNWGAPKPSAGRTWARTVGILVATLIGAVVVLGVVGAIVGNQTSSSVVPQTSESGFYRKVDQFARRQLDLASPLPGRIASTNCAFPKKWTAGESFNCYVYGHSGNELGEVTVTVLTTSPGDAWNANFFWVPNFF